MISPLYNKQSASIRKLEERIKALESLLNDPVTRVKLNLLSLCTTKASFLTVQPDYYNLSLSARAEILKCNESQLCKSIIFENVATDEDILDDISGRKYYCVIVQYNAKINIEKLKEFIINLRVIKKSTSKSKINFQLASSETSLALSGFPHNAVTPFALATPIPIILSKACLALEPAYIWMGGGKVDVKLGMPISQFLQASNALIADVSDPRFDDNFDTE